MKGLNALCLVWLCSGDARLGGRRVRRNVHVSLTQRETNVGRAKITPRSEVELCDRSLSARVRVLAVDALAVTLHLGEVLVEDLARSQRRHQVVKLAAVVLPVGLCFPGLSLLLPLLFQLVTQRLKVIHQRSYLKLNHSLKATLDTVKAELNSTINL